MNEKYQNNLGIVGLQHHRCWGAGRNPAFGASWPDNTEGCVTEWPEIIYAAAQSRGHEASHCWSEGERHRGEVLPVPWLKWRLLSTFELSGKFHSRIYQTRILPSIRGTTLATTWSMSSPQVPVSLKPTAWKWTNPTVLEFRCENLASNVGGFVAILFT